ncbi:hypothetical protein MSG28_014642 [Choristoneura fumiferana]|uniref:Uncharacterized protein n=1 Tax=Choristoneura fumiferana TaxID=7141 RepID=A0ACC0JSD5_CHOFU|nr:hypothetical protein MSG28_014642 [Choristoneura fumiferana]
MLLFQVTYVTPYPDIMKPAKGLRVVNVNATLKIFEGMDIINTATKGDFRKVLAYGRDIISIAMETPELQNILKKEDFDAVVSEWFFSDVNAGGTVMSSHMESLVDDIRTTAIIPALLAEFPIPMSLWQRLMNTFITAGMTFGTWLDQASNEALYHSLFGPIAEARGVTLPPYMDALYNVSILFSNSHPSMSTAQSLPPNVVQIAGYHIDMKIPPLPKDLQDLLDGSPQGVVYFSMGSVVKSAAIPLEQRQDLIRVLGALPYTVLWNIPVYGDQSTNAFRSVVAGYALRVPFRPWSAAAFEDALKEILGNDSYYKRAKHLSKVFHNRPVEPSKLISHYVETAIETQGAYHLRSPSRHYQWYERYMFDQLVVILAVLYILGKILKALFRFIKSLFVGSKVSKVKKETKSKKVKAQ